MQEVLKRLGLTDSEAKVYIALLELGPVTKGALIRRSRIASSKIYEVIDKLVDKGLACVFQQNKVRHFNAAPPSRIRDYLDGKREDIDRQKKIFEELLPELTSRRKHAELETDAEIFRGWNGVKTVYLDILQTLERGDTDLVFGAGELDSEKARKFFGWFNKERHRRGIKIKIVFNESVRGNAPPYLQKGDSIRYAPIKTPTEINIYKDRTILLTLSEEPVAILIRNEKTADSFREYFDQMWKMSSS